MGRALLIEESVALRASYSKYLSTRGIEIYTAHGAVDAMALLDTIKPEVTALDLDLQSADPFNLISSIRDTGSLCLVISDRDSTNDRIRALSLGADDYLAKPLELEELFLRIRNMLTRPQPPGSESQGTILDLHGIRIDLVSRALLDADGAAGPRLTATELAMMRILAGNIERVVSKETLFGAMRGDSYSTAARSLDVGISRLRLKLRNAGAPIDLRSVRQAGYILSRITALRA